MGDNHQLFLEKITPFISSEIRTLCDYGCGNGNMLKLISERFPQIQCTGIDYFEKYKIEKLNTPSLQWIDKDNADALTQKSYDMIISTFALHHFQYPLAELKQIFQMLKDQGIMIFFDFSLALDSKAKIAKSLSSLIGEIEASLKNSYHRHHYTLEEAMDLFQIIPVEILLSTSIQNDLTDEERLNEQKEFLNKNHQKRNLIESNASDFWKSIWLPLTDLERNIACQHSVDYSDLFMIVAKK